jgi:hypothetical protein
MKPAAQLTLDKAKRFAKMAAQELNLLVYDDGGLYADGISNRELELLHLALKNLTLSIERM